jgi:hypothetical protein
MENIEKKDPLYLGKLQRGDKPFLYDSKNLTTHAICLGMTGSGKTGLGIALLEEAGLNKIPAIIIDPKGDLTNLLLTFPRLSPEEFRPWVEEGDAEKTAKVWKEGLASSNETPERIARLKDSVEMTIYTPGSNSGVPISILSSFTAPPKELCQDPEAFSDRVQSVVSSLLGLLGIDADPIKSREHILISTILSSSWSQGKDLDLASLIGLVQKPPFDKVGALDLESFFPPKERMNLAMSLNHLLAAPGFQAWIKGEPLDIQNLLYAKSGKAKFSILTIAHLSSNEQMFFVTLLLNEFLAWMRRQPGTSNLKSILYMDEIFGFFPPLGNPPSKMPMLRLLKTARAFGAGIILSTQNPVDLDYKGLANCGTWFIGKLQTERDRARVVDGLKSASNGEFDTKTLRDMLATLASRTFILRSIYEKNPLLFQTRWTLSYLRGPLTLAEIQLLTGRQNLPPQETPKPSSPQKPALPSGINEYYLNGSKGTYEPKLLGIANLHFVDAKNKIDLWQEVCIAAPFDPGSKEILWEKGERIAKDTLEKAPSEGSVFSDLPSSLMQEKNYTPFRNAFSAYLFQNYTYDASLNRKTDSAKISSLKEKIRKTEEKIAQKQSCAQSKKWNTFLAFIKTILGAFLGKGFTKGTLTSAETSLGKLGKISKDSEAANGLEQEWVAYKSELADLQSSESVPLRPRKSDIRIEKIALLWKK